MRPWLSACLVASLVLSGLAAWWPAPDADDDGLLAPRALARPVQGPFPGSSRTQVASTAPPVAMASQPADKAAAVTQPATGTGTGTGTNTSATLSLSTRAADWPAPGAAALAAWQGGAPVQPAAPLSASPAAAAASAAPVFPYQWIGQLDDGGAPQALLASAQRSVGVRQGAVVDGRWRLDRAPGEPWKATHLPSGVVVSVRGSPVAAAP